MPLPTGTHQTTKNVNQAGCSLAQPSRPPCPLHQHGDAFQLDNAEGDVEPNCAGVSQGGVALLRDGLQIG
jgi:hypothetical protein